MAPRVRVTVVAAEGSTPRETGAVMVVDDADIAGTVGGGRLEYEAIALARALLAAPPQPFLRAMRRWPLGPSLGQCCGGAVTLLFERFGEEECAAVAALGALGAGEAYRRSVESGQPIERGPAERVGLVDGIFIEPAPAGRRPLFLYGAGHVGRALAPILTTLPIDLHWVDDAEERFPEVRPNAAHRVLAKQPALIADAAPAGAIHIVMTYAHDVDLAICHAALASGRAGFVGLIGSATKRARFRSRLKDAGLGAEAIDRLVCPIGLATLSGKTPAVIAIGVAAQVAKLLELSGQAPKN